MSTFTPPTVLEVPSVSVADSRSGPMTSQANRLGYRLMRFFSSRERGVMVFKMSDGTYRMSEQVPGVTVTATEPYPPVPAGQVVNGALAQSWFDGSMTDYPLDSPTVTAVYYGGHSYEVSSDEAAALSAAGFGSYLS